MVKPLSEMSLEELWELFPIIMKDHNPAYKEWYIIEKDAILNVIDQNYVKRINHIGSTAVEGLIAKPTIDILLEVDPDCNIEQLKTDLRHAGWTPMAFQSEPFLNISLNKGYTPDGFAEKVFHLHVRYWGDWDELYFRDYLIVHPEVAGQYGQLKQSLKDCYTHDRDGYTAAKTKFITEWTQAARKDFPGRYAIPGVSNDGKSMNGAQC